MATPWQQVLEQVPSLNDDKEPFTYAVDGEVIVGTWDIAKIRMLGLTGGSALDKDYRIEIRPTGDGQIDWTETSTTSKGQAGLSGASGSKSFFKGKSVSKSGGISIGLKGSNKGKVTKVATYSFSTSRIKDPVMGMLEQNGWEKKGLIGRLFG